ncbi:unnamed protein product [Chondrus crispus]|uniref:Large ribosomal subunit protein mL53 n=1 Tax=Chondrus crispus TaxID=2769 RepID=R7Q508_CHOCR|nr:unnamed protein product [Chondrus crispus]CDF32525.1 unnamed protein product [Chondrus crispus]|eukprot:XP_005712190.1 unnamed protein product [Chondrus crispus]
MGQLVRAVAASRKSSELFKTLRAVRVELNPFDHRSTTAREFLRRVRSPAVREANAKLKVDVHLIEEYGRATIGLEYACGAVERGRAQPVRRGARSACQTARAVTRSITRDSASRPVARVFLFPACHSKG